ncbi:Omega-hydroxypalmitate O-feruloyl transferase [Acorus gramineus]|uniref:Omega-hydroxypalmitate O-feruloyl transferase n=1 Tax=Acorus gramineus TaxID=55184 RepID=A0AAV9B3A8_ACOGR|nr:Omega-hydroxypalmitate O-feruloyl transferase [Acorus gramineus]
MGSFPQTLPKDLKITFKSTSLVHPPPLTLERRRSMFLSNIDQLFNFDMETVHFFSAVESFPPSTVCDAIKRALQQLLVPYDFLAGRLRTDPVKGRLEVDCNGAGAGFVVASSEMTLEEVGDLTYPHPAFKNLVPTRSLKGLEDWPLMAIQVTSFKCGGFAVGISNNHATFDGTTFKTFLDNLASLATSSEGTLSVHPCNDRDLLSARSPPRVTFPHPELTNSTDSILGASINGTPIETKLFHLTASDITLLKQKANSPHEAGPAPTSFNAVTAHVWRCHAAATAAKTSTLLYMVDLRSRLRLHLPKSYAGCAVWGAYATATRDELVEGQFDRVVESVREGKERVTEEYVRSVVDALEMGKGGALMSGDLLVTSWWRLGLETVGYPWGSPLYCCPIVDRRRGIAVFVPEIRGSDGGSGGSGGMNIFISLSAGDEAELFEKMFYEFLKS